MSKEELEELVAAEEKRLGVGSREFMERHNEIMADIERLMEEKRERDAQRAKQIVTAKDVMAALEVSESKAYGIIKQLNQELAAKGYITIPGKVSRAYFEEKCYGVRVGAE